MYKYPDISKETLKIAEETEKKLSEIFSEIEYISEANQYKVLSAFIRNRVSESDFYCGSGYGYNEAGREKLEKVYSDIFHTEDALVRAQITCGTHALALALNSLLISGDEILFISGKPYDSLEKTIGITPSPCSLAENGISYSIVDLINDAQFDFDKIKSSINSRTKIVYIQRSKGYSTRDTLSPRYIGEVISFVKDIKKDLICFVDNCYGEFVDLEEPSDYGADICVGSLIKNPGGSLAETGGYIVGKKELIERCSYKLTAPGLGKEVGPSLGVLRSFFQGLSLAPSITANAVKNAVLAAAMYEHFGYETFPASDKKHHCIVEAINLRSADKVKKFCAAMQYNSYVDSFVTPEEYNMPGYADKIIMASGAFMSGSSIELSADGPMREPYTVFFQGGLTYEHGKYAILKSIDLIANNPDMC